MPDQSQLNLLFKVWDSAKCGYCEHDASKDKEEPYLYYLTCPTCGREGCGECMPAGRGCECPECENNNK